MLGKQHGILEKITESKRSGPKKLSMHGNRIWPTGELLNYKTNEFQQCRAEMTNKYSRFFQGKNLELFKGYTRAINGCIVCNCLLKNMSKPRA